MSPDTGRINLLDLSFADLQRHVVDWGQPRFRATQIWRWIYHTLTDNPDEMVNLPKDLRARLAQELYVGRLDVVDKQVAEDGLTEKVLFRTYPGEMFETVLMRYNNRNTVCVSSQIGCAVGCSFCATGQAGFTRDMTTGEISAQVLYFARELQKENAHVTNVVLMGMGEPMLNFDAVWQAVANLNDREGLALGARRFTISTSGVVPGIERMARESLALGLAISLHAPDDALRDELVPINKRYPIASLLEACRTYIARKGRRVTFEYALMAGVNDSVELAQATADLLRGMLCHVNLIPLNATPDCPYDPSSRNQVMRFQEVLVKGGIQTTVRLKRGIEIKAGCGQLAGRHRGKGAGA